MSPKIHRLLVLCAAALIAMSGAACSKKTTKPTPPPPPLTQEAADDMVQQMAMSIATDQGGWLVDLQSTLGSMYSGPAPGAPHSSTSRRLLALPANAVPRARTNRDTSFTRAQMSFEFFYYYTNINGDSLGAWADSDTVAQVDGRCVANGTIVGTTPAFTTTYRHIDDPLTATGFEAASDTIYFTGVGDDSLFCTFTPAFRTGTRFFSTTSFVDYDLRTRRDPNGFPISGEANAYIFADVLNSANITDIATTLEGTVTFHFDGTQTPLVTITNDLENPAPQHSYRADLHTGAITRVP